MSAIKGVACIPANVYLKIHNVTYFIFGGDNLIQLFDLSSIRTVIVVFCVSDLRAPEFGDFAMVTYR